MKRTLISIVIVGILIGGAILISKNNVSNSSNSNLRANNVSIVDGKQIITINVKGGYWPGSTVAKAGLPTLLRLDTKGTFDCSSYIRIPSMNITKMLPNSGETDIELGTPNAGQLQGMCGMGMYRFNIDFSQ